MQNNRKSKRAYNSLRHGLLSRAIIPGEKIRGFRRIAKDLKAELMPNGEIESLLVDKVVMDVWRLKRALKIENDLMESVSKTADRFPERFKDSNFGEVFNYLANNDKFRNFIRYLASIERSVYRSLHELQALRNTKKDYKTKPASHNSRGRT